jgi:hypothetical protein
MQKLSFIWTTTQTLSRLRVRNLEGILIGSEDEECRNDHEYTWGNSPCPNLKGRLVEQAIESERPSNVVVFGKCSAGLKATSGKGRCRILE